MTSLKLTIKKQQQEGDLANKYRALQNVLDKNGEITGFNIDASELGIDLNHPINVECQPSYDGTVNLILNDDKNPPRIINTRFSKTEDNRYKIINRNQLEQTNLYRIKKIDQQTRLFRNINYIPRIDLIKVSNIGQLKGGNYTFYIKFADNDYNKTDIVAESGQVPIFKGNVDKPETISGTVYNELTDKAVVLKIRNIDTSFSKFYVYYVRNTSDENGVRLTKAGMISKPYDIISNEVTITINGYEEIEELSPEEINVQYNIVSAVKTQAQVQNMLFFGNVQGLVVNIKELQNASYFINVSLQQDEEGVGWINTKDYSLKDNASTSESEYYNPLNVYYKLGYWPDEMYRLGIVYIMKDDSLSPVFNLRGCAFTDFNESNIKTNLNYKDGDKINYLERDTFISGGINYENTFGVFKNPNKEIIDYKNICVKPLYYQITISEDIKTVLENYGVKGYFIVRQKRIPTTLCEGFSVGVDNTSYVPMLYDDTESYVTEGFLNSSGVLTQSFTDHKKRTKKKQCSGLISLDANVIPTLQSTFDGTDFVLKPTYTKSGTLNCENRHYYQSTESYKEYNEDNLQLSTSAVFVDSETPLKYINGHYYSTKCGEAENVGKFSFFNTISYIEGARNFLRGIWCPFIGIGMSLMDNAVYDVKIPGYSNSKLKDYFSIRGNDNSAFFAISQRYDLSKSTLDVYSGDCYTNTVTIRINRNFTDPEVPISDTIVKPYTWRDNYKGYDNTYDETSDDKTKGSYADMNRADINSVHLGMWLTYKCLSNYNLGLRTVDTSHSDELALLGSSRGFYPVADMTTSSVMKVEDSRLLNEGYSATVGYKEYFVADNVPYIKELYDNRVMFSNVQQDDDFKNAYRIFQGLSYKDIDRQYGAIVKFIPWGVNIFCVFEHGLGIIPINEKALIQSNTGQSIHMYGAGVLQNQISLISPDFGSTWPESVIKTPKGIYGVDTYAKKIWRYTDSSGLENISDMRIQQFLNSNIKLSEQDKYPTVGTKNVKTHYNNYKGDVMFTFYNDTKDTDWNLCFNERIDKWITRYSWTPLYSENINNIFYSFNQKNVGVLGDIYNNKHCTCGIRCNTNEWKIYDTTGFNLLQAKLNIVGYSFTEDSEYVIKSITYKYKDSSDVVKDCTLQYISRDDYTGPDGDDGWKNANYFFIEKKTGILQCTQSKIEEAIGDIWTNGIPAYFQITVECHVKQDNIDSGTVTDVIGLVIKDAGFVQTEAFLKNGFYIHGRAGIFDGINYEDNIYTNQILPTKWYDVQEPFEFEFVVSDPIGAHKIFDNLVIVSNNVQPKEIEYEFTGDVYNFNKAGIFRNKQWGTTYSTWAQDKSYTKPGVVIPDKIEGLDDDIEWPDVDNKGNISTPRVKKAQSSRTTQEFINADVQWDNDLNSYSLLVKQPCKNIEEFGRRLGNIQYKEDSWYITIDPLRYREIGMGDIEEDSKDVNNIKSAKLRDKYIKIRIKYTGTDAVIITALKTITTLSYA